MPEYILAGTDEAYKAAAKLFSEYAAWLDIDLCFQHFDEELATLEKMYAPPYGGIILCKENNEYIACVALRKISDDTAELKRMFVQEAHQQKGIGNELMIRSLKLARQSGYKMIRLDTLGHMRPAINLYKKFGFRETSPYYHNPHSTAVYFELTL